mmetsp:Transcript_17113/g.33433  ORF Transcript_17113/g.33433 Transcript_17113/m.33433 type:complete len:96 (+) Transcript_17113:834-1121(+)
MPSFSLRRYTQQDSCTARWDLQQRPPTGLVRMATPKCGEEHHAASASAARMQYATWTPRAVPACSHAAVLAKLLFFQWHDGKNTSKALQTPWGSP